MNRQEANQEILKILSDHIGKNPDVRFQQMLWNLGIICWDDTKDNILDLYGQESVDTLADLEEEIAKNRFTEYSK